MEQFFSLSLFYIDYEILKKHLIMKKGIHPKNYRLVAFKDMSSEEIFLCRSTAETKDQIEIDNVKYPLIKIEISSSSHPFYIGKIRFVDTAGRVDKFLTKYKNYGKTNF